MFDAEHSRSYATYVPAGDSQALAVVAVVCSAGSLAPLRTMVRQLGSDFHPAVIISQHVGARSLLPDLLRLESALPVTFAQSGMLLQSGVVYVCPPQHHVVVNPDASLSLSTRGRVNRVRPNGDWLFESASASYRERLAAVVLSGGQNDGAAGVGHVRERGGLVFAQ